MCAFEEFFRRLGSNEFFFVKGCYETTSVLFGAAVVIITTGILGSQTNKHSSTVIPGCLEPGFTRACT